MAKWQRFGRTTQRSRFDTVAVIGMGRFGQSLALELMSIGVDVLAVDRDEEIISGLNGLVTHAVIADATKEDVLHQLAVPEMDTVVVAIGDSIEANVLVSSLVLSLGITDVWAKAVSEPHGRILRQIGVHHVVQPENEMGKRVAHLLHGRLQDWIEIGDGLTLVKTTPPEEVTGQPIRDLHIRSRYGVTVISVKRGSGPWSDVTGDTVLRSGDQILVTGPTAKAEGFHRNA